MNQAVDMNPSEFRRHARAVELRLQRADVRKNVPTSVEGQPQQLTVDYAHTTDSTSFLLALLECPPVLRAFVDALIGLAGYRASPPDWFYATDEDIARRAIRCEKWVQLQRNEFIKWQRRLNVGLIDIEDNKYQGGERVPHRYRVKLARYAAEITQDARVSEYWNRHQFDRAFEEAARLLLDSVLVPPIHIRHKHLSRPSAEKSMERDLNFALTKIRKAKATSESARNQIRLNDPMGETIASIRRELEALEETMRSRDDNDGSKHGGKVFHHGPLVVPAS